MFRGWSNRTVTPQYEDDTEQRGFIQLGDIPPARGKGLQVWQPRAHRSSSLVSINGDDRDFSEREIVAPNVIHVRSEVVIRGEAGPV